MAEILDTGYISLRTLIVKEWNKFILLDGEGDSVYETELKEENWIHDRDTEEVYYGEDGMGIPVYGDEEYESNEELEFEVVVKGSDVGSLPVTVSSTKVQEKYSANEDNKYRDVSIETFSDYTFENVEDELTVKHKIKVPKVD